MDALDPKLCLKEQVLTLESMFSVQDLKGCPNKILSVNEHSLVGSLERFVRYD